MPQVFRITLEQYAGALVASGLPARWNGREVRMIYTASSRALACLENVVHRSGIGLQQHFRTMVIMIPDGLPLKVVRPEDLPEDWFGFEQYPYTQSIGNAWIRSGETAVLQVPSAIIAEECNYLLNPAHPQFGEVRLLRAEPFVFDPRIKG